MITRTEENRRRVIKTWEFQTYKEVAGTELEKFIWRRIHLLCITWCLPVGPKVVLTHKLNDLCEIQTYTNWSRIEVLINGKTNKQNKKKSVERIWVYRKKITVDLAAWSGWREDAHLLNKVLMGLLVHSQEEPLSVGKSLY